MDIPRPSLRGHEDAPILDVFRGSASIFECRRGLKNLISPFASWKSSKNTLKKQNKKKTTTISRKFY